MDPENDQEACPCESGLPFPQCCGVPGRTALSADVSLYLPERESEKSVRVTSQIQAAIDTFDRNPDLFPARINFFDDKAFFVKMSPHWYRESVFLDPGRIKGTFVAEASLHWVQEKTDVIQWQPLAFIFHTAFCGSTLMSQALDALYETVPLREPEVLGNLMMYLRSGAQDVNKVSWFSRVLLLLSRRYDGQQIPVIKANDYANPLLMDLLQWQNEIPVLFMYTPMREFLAGCLKAENRQQWIKQRFDSIKPFAHEVIGVSALPDIAENAYGEMACVYWSYNVAYFMKSQSSNPPRIHSLDFNTMLKHPAECIKACADLFELRQKPGINVDEMIQSLFGVYSKNSNFKYSPEQRELDIDRTLQTHAESVEQAEKLADYLWENLDGAKPNNIRDNIAQIELPAALLKV